MEKQNLLSNASRETLEKIDGQISARHKELTDTIMSNSNEKTDSPKRAWQKKNQTSYKS